MFSAAHTLLRNSCHDFCNFCSVRIQDRRPIHQIGSPRRVVGHRATAG